MFVAGKVGSSSFVLGLGTWWGGENGPCWEAMARGDLYLPGWVVLTVGAQNEQGMLACALNWLNLELLIMMYS